MAPRRQSWRKRRRGRCERWESGEAGRLGSKQGSQNEEPSGASASEGPWLRPRFPASLLSRLMPPRRERDDVTRVLLVTEEQPSLAERGAAEREGKNFAQLLNQEHFDLVAHLARQIL